MLERDQSAHQHVSHQSDERKTRPQQQQDVAIANGFVQEIRREPVAEYPYEGNVGQV